MIRAVFFDFAGVVVSEGFWDWIYKNVPHIDQIKVEIDQLSRKVDRGELPARAYETFLAEKTGKNPDTVKNEILNNYVLDKKIIVLLEKLRPKTKTAILSNFPVDWFYSLIEKYDLKQYFDAIIISSEYGLIKPEEAFYKKALDVVGVQADEAVFIDDRQENVDAVKKLGMHGVVFTSVDVLQKDLEKLGLSV